MMIFYCSTVLLASLGYGNISGNEEQVTLVTSEALRRDAAVDEGGSVRFHRSRLYWALIALHIQNNNFWLGHRRHI
jgi:hypothetical protein